MSISTEKYSVFLLDGQTGTIIPYNDGAFALDHGQEYKIHIVNHDKNLKIDAVVDVDGKPVGTFRVNPSGIAEIERTVKVDRKLTFYATNSNEGRMANLGFNSEAGTIVVTISSEANSSRKRPKKKLYHTDYVECDGPEAGGTGLGAHSNQRFEPAPSIKMDQQRYVLAAKMVCKSRISVIPL